MKNNSNHIYVAFTGVFNDEDIANIKSEMNNIFDNLNEIAFVHDLDNADYSEIVYQIQKPVFNTEQANLAFFLILRTMFTKLRKYDPYFTKFKKEVTYND